MSDKMVLAIGRKLQFLSAKTSIRLLGKETLKIL